MFIVLIVLNALFVWSPARAGAVTATDYGYPYPNAPDCNEQTGANCVPDQWGFVQGQCHSWVAYRLNELNHTELQGETFNDWYHEPSGEQWGSTWHWGEAAAAAGIAVDDHPALGSVAWWSDNGGHVGYVEAVNADGTVTISEMNLDLHNGFDFATLQRGQRWPTGGFIHIADRPTSAPTVPDAPRDVHATGGNGTVRVTWSAPSDNGGSPLTGYAVTGSPGNLSTSVSATTTAATFTVSPGTYTFRVIAKNAVGTSASSTSSAPVTVMPSSYTYVARFTDDAYAFLTKTAQHFHLAVGSVPSNGVAALAYILGLVHASGTAAVGPLPNSGPHVIDATYDANANASTVAPVEHHFVVDGDDALYLGAAFMMYVAAIQGVS